MFSEPLPAGEETAAVSLPEPLPWSGPPAPETGAVLAVEQIVARSPNVVVRLPTIRAFRSGCMFDMEVVSRPGEMSEDDWWDLRISSHGYYHQLRGGVALPRKLLRLGARYADGRKATTIEQRRRRHRGRREPVGLLLARDRACVAHPRLARGYRGWPWSIGVGGNREVPAWMMGAVRYRREVAAVEGWRSVEELIGWGFAHAPVVMANEAHNGLARCIRTRDIGVRMIQAAHEAGVRRLAMEALPWPAPDTPGSILAIPHGAGGYLAQPDMRRLIAAALELGWSLWAYEAVFEAAARTDPAEMLTMEFTNWREREQARNLCQLRAAAPAEPLLVWCGNGHAGKEVVQDWVPMGWHFRAMSGTDPFVIDQTVSVTFQGKPQPWVQELLAALGQTLAAYGGTAGILRDQAPGLLSSRRGVDAVVVSTDNTLT